PRHPLPSAALSPDPDLGRAAPVQFPALAGGLCRSVVRRHALAGFRRRRAPRRHRGICEARAALRRPVTDSSQPEPQAPKGSDLTVRFAAGVAMIAVAVLLAILGGWFFRAFVLLAAALMLVEWADMHKLPRLWAWIGAALAAATLLGGAEYFYPVNYDPDTSDALVEMTWLSLAPALGGALLLGLASRKMVMGWGFLYIVLPALCLVVLSWETYGGGALVFWAFIVTWATDIFAYFAGRAIGGPKLAPKISPNKTWAGLIGGMVGASFCGWLAARYFELGTPFLWIGATM